MSYSTPFRREDGFHRKKRKEDTSLVAQARRAAEQLPKPPEDEVAVSRPLREDEKKTASAAPPLLDLLAFHEEERAAARASGNIELANSALVSVVRDLDVLLDSTESYLKQTNRGKSRRRVRNAMPHLVAISAVSDLPLDEVAEFLGLPQDRVKDVLDSLAKRGGVSAAERQNALGQVKWLRSQLRRVIITKDHSLLDRLLEFVSRFVLLGVVALASAASGAAAVGESVLKEVVKTAVVTLVAAALQMSTDHLLAQRTKQSRRSAAREAHAALLSDLSMAGALWDAPAYDGEHAVIRIKLAIRMCAARVATLPLEWPEKWQYWDLLDNVSATLTAKTPDRFSAELRRITALSPPA